jgi:hypothetical protein
MVAWTTNLEAIANKGLISNDNIGVDANQYHNHCIAYLLLGSIELVAISSINNKSSQQETRHKKRASERHTHTHRERERMRE